MKQLCVLVIATVMFPLGLRARGNAQRVGAQPTVERSDHRQPGAIVVQNYYYAKAGKADEVYRWRLHASDVRAKLGFPRGRVLHRIGADLQAVASEDLPDVIWECEYASAEARERDSRAVGANSEFQEVQKHMGTLTRRFARGRYEVEEPPPSDNKR